MATRQQRRQREFINNSNVKGTSIAHGINGEVECTVLRPNDVVNTYHRNDFSTDLRQHQKQKRSLGLEQCKFCVSWIVSRQLPLLFVLATMISCVVLIRTGISYPFHSSSDSIISPEQFAQWYGTFAENPSTNSVVADSNTTIRNILTLFLEETQQPPSFRDSKYIKSPHLTKVEFPHMGITSCDDENIVPKLPIDEFPHGDPYLPWIHDYHINFPEITQVRFVAQNKRRCQTGFGMESIMKHWEPQIALFQPIPIKVMDFSSKNRYNTIESVTKPQTAALNNSKVLYRISSPEDATYRETRFLCRFHTYNYNNITGTTSLSEITTFSTYFFNYEYVMWRKSHLPMYKISDGDGKFELSQLLFACPIPASFREKLLDTFEISSSPQIFLDVIPIRTPPRHSKFPLATVDMIGPYLYESIQNESASAHEGWYNVTQQHNSIDSGRWSNLPLCGARRGAVFNGTGATFGTTGARASSSDIKSHHLVACTWTSAAYKRRGDAIIIDDAPSRLKEWIIFHRIAGIDHIYVYDNTQVSKDEHNATTFRTLQSICAQFADFVTHIPWPATVCNNNRPNHKNPGDRSSQYAAEASCRSRYGEFTKWMTFIDTDEYLVPMMHTVDNQNRTAPTTWHDILRKMEQKRFYILKLPSSRGRPRLNLMDVTNHVSACDAQKQRWNPSNDSCLVPRQNETFLRVYKYVAYA
jgi:hypothetical protein